MNNTVEQFTRDQILEGLKELPESWVFMFKRMYSHENLDAKIEDVVNSMPSDKLDWALSQVQNSIKRFKKLTSKD